MWVPPEIKDPILQHAPTRKSVACFSAVSLVTGQFVRMMCAIFNAATFLSFLKRLLRQKTSGRRRILVLDNARYHHALLLARFLRRHSQDLQLLFLPPYSPQIAPIERVWKLPRRLATHNRYFATLPEVLKAVNACFNRWRRPDECQGCCRLVSAARRSYGDRRGSWSSDCLGGEASFRIQLVAPGLIEEYPVMMELLVGFAGSAIVRDIAGK